MPPPFFFYRFAIAHGGGRLSIFARPARADSLESGAIRSAVRSMRKKKRRMHMSFAVPPYRARRLLPESVKQRTIARELRQNKSFTDYGVHFWFDRQVMTRTFITLIDTPRSGFSTKTELHGDANGRGNKTDGGQYSLVISAS